MGKRCPVEHFEYSLKTSPLEFILEKYEDKNLEFSEKKVLHSTRFPESFPKFSK